MRRNKDFDGDDGFVSPADIEDGYKPGMSDAERGEREARSRSFSQGTSDVNPQFNFGLPADKKEAEKAKEVEIVQGKDGQMQIAGTETDEKSKTDNGFVRTERSPFDKSSKSYEDISVEDRKRMSDSELSDAALAYQEEQEDRADEKAFAEMEARAAKNPEIVKAMSNGEAVAEKERQAAKNAEDTKDVPN